MAFGATAVAELVTRVTTEAETRGLDQATESTSRLGKAGSIAGKALALGLAAAGAAALKFAGMAAEDEASAAKMAQALEKTAGATDAQVAATENWIAAQGKALGVADDQLRPAITALAGATHDVSKAQDLASLAMDISARKGKSLQSVSDALAKAYTTGNVSALARYNVATKNADGSTRSLAEVTADLTKSYSGAAEAQAKTAEGTKQRLNVAMDELQETIGYKLLPVLLLLSQYGLQVVDWIEKNQTVVGIFLGSLAGLLAAVWAVSKAIQAWRAISAAYTAVQWALNAALTANPIGLVVVAIAALVAGLILAYQHSEKVRTVVDAIGDAAKAVYDWIKSHWKLLAAILFGPFGIALGQIITHRDKIIDAVRRAIDWIKDHWEALAVILGGPFGAALVVIIKNRDRIIDAVGRVIDWLRDHWDTIQDIMTAPFRLAADVIGNQKDRIVSIAERARSAVVGAFKAMASPVLDLIDAVQRLIDKLGSIHVPDIDLPGIPGLKVIGSASPSTSSTTTTTPAVVNNYTIDMSGVLDTGQGMDRFLTLLRRHARETGGNVVVAL